MRGVCGTLMRLKTKWPAGFRRYLNRMIEMQTRRLGKAGLELTTMGLGTWAIGGPWQYGWGPQEDDDSIRTILAALDGGVNWLDTAPIYGCGHSETVVGQALGQMRQRPLVATKCGLVWNEKREKINCLDAASILRECENSLRRLGVEVIDLYQLHWPQPEAQLEEAWEAMARCVQQGKVRYLGASNVTTAHLERIAKVHPVASIQPPYSLLRRDVEKELLGYCTAHQIGMVCYSPMQKGLLSGAFSAAKMQTLPPDDHRHNDPMFKGDRLGAILAMVDALRPIAARYGKTVGQLAIAWTLRQPAVTSAIVGARTPEQIASLLPAGDWTLDADTVAEIETLLSR